MSQSIPMVLLLLLSLPVLSGIGRPAEAAGPDLLWTELAAGRAAALMRHALAPGTGDPRGLDLADCATQRNLDEFGREQARRTGAAFHSNGIAAATVYSSAWCRCRETAELLQLGPVEIRPALNSFFADRSRQAAQTQALRQLLAEAPRGAPLVLVSHQVNITALTGIVPRSGEIVVVSRDAGARLLGRLPALESD